MRNVAGAPVNAVRQDLVRSRDTVQAAIDDPAFAAIGNNVEVSANTPGNRRKPLLVGNAAGAADAAYSADRHNARAHGPRPRRGAPVSVPPI